MQIWDHKSVGTFLWQMLNKKNLLGVLSFRQNIYFAKNEEKGVKKNLFSIFIHVFNFHNLLEKVVWKVWVGYPGAEPLNMHINSWWIVGYGKFNRLNFKRDKYIIRIFNNSQYFISKKDLWLYETYYFCLTRCNILKGC